MHDDGSILQVRGDGPGAHGVCCDRGLACCERLLFEDALAGEELRAYARDRGGGGIELVLESEGEITGFCYGARARTASLSLDAAAVRALADRVGGGDADVPVELFCTAFRGPDFLERVGSVLEMLGIEPETCAGRAPGRADGSGVADGPHPNTCDFLWE